MSLATVDARLGSVLRGRATVRGDRSGAVEAREADRYPLLGGGLECPLGWCTANREAGNSHRGKSKFPVTLPMSASCTLRRRSTG